MKSTESATRMLAGLASAAAALVMTAAPAWAHPGHEHVGAFAHEAAQAMSSVEHLAAIALAIGMPAALALLIVLSGRTGRDRS